MAADWIGKIEDGQILLIDGGTGTEFQKRGAPMDTAAWSGAAVLSHGDILRGIHEDYIRAGAEVIVTNTFGTTRQMLEPAGLGGEVKAINQRAVAVAQEARDNAAGHPVAIAGSLSAMPPRFDRDAYPPPEEELANYRELAGILAESGVDIIALEMMEDVIHAPLAMEAALETGLPVWLGMSCKLDNDTHQIVSFDSVSGDFRKPLDTLIPLGPTAVNLMHSEIRAIPEAVRLVRERWKGPLGVYPESGHFASPNWEFVDVISPEDLAEEARKWVAAGVCLLGGCCGTGPEHIAALRDAIPSYAERGTS